MAIDTPIDVKYTSPVSQANGVTSSSHSGCVNACTRSATFQRKPNP
jgi:hypothetical protein